MYRCALCTRCAISCMHTSPPHLRSPLTIFISRRPLLVLSRISYLVSRISSSRTTGRASSCGVGRAMWSEALSTVEPPLGHTPRDTRFTMPYWRVCVNRGRIRASNGRQTPIHGRLSWGVYPTHAEHSSQPTAGSCCMGCSIRRILKS